MINVTFINEYGRKIPCIVAGMDYEKGITIVDKETGVPQECIFNPYHKSYFELCKLTNRNHNERDIKQAIRENQSRLIKEYDSSYKNIIHNITMHGVVNITKADKHSFSFVEFDILKKVCPYG